MDRQTRSRAREASAGCTIFKQDTAWNNFESTDVGEVCRTNSFPPRRVCG